MKLDLRPLCSQKGNRENEQCVSFGNRIDGKAKLSPVQKIFIGQRRADFSVTLSFSF